MTNPLAALAHELCRRKASFSHTPDGGCKATFWATAGGTRLQSVAAETPGRLLARLAEALGLPLAGADLPGVETVTVTAAPAGLLAALQLYRQHTDARRLEAARLAKDLAGDVALLREAEALCRPPAPVEKTADGWHAKEVG